MLMIIHQQMAPFSAPSRFRLIPRWNQTLASGSSRIGITPSVQAHHALEDSVTHAAPLTVIKWRVGKAYSEDDTRHIRRR
jgi:hypothetical protein